MMFVMGIDFSSFYVDCVKVPLDTDRSAQWHRFPLTGSDAFNRTRSVRDAMPGRSSVFHDDILAVGIEEPTGKFKPGTGYRVQGAILACLPPHLLVHPLTPSKWRKLVGLPGNASKSDVAAWGAPSLGEALPQDAYDALAISHATRALITRKENAA